jgi:LuxR family maltose regulon positive regulatory protein
LAGDDTGHVARLLETHGTALLMGGALAPLRRWLAILGDAVVRDSAYLCVLHAWVLLLTGEWATLEPNLQRAEELWVPAAGAPVSDLPGHVAAIRSYMASHQGDAVSTIEMANRSLDLLDPGSLGIRAVVTFVLGGAYLMAGDLHAAADAMAQAASLGRQGGNPHVAVPALNALASVRMQQGRLREAQEITNQALRLATSPSGILLPIGAGALSELAELALERDDTESALAYARRCVDLSEQWGNSDVLCSSYLTLAGILLVLGEAAAAREALRKAEQVASRFAVSPQLGTYLRAGWARQHLAEGDLSALEGWLREAGSADPGPAAYSVQALTLARVRLVLLQHDEALDVLHPLLETARAQRLDGVVAEALVLVAMAHEAAEAEEQALAAVAEALALTEPEGHVRLFLNEGPPMARLLRKEAARGVAPGQVSRLLQAFGRETNGQLGAAGRRMAEDALGSLVEPLSDRELQVLQLVAGGATNRQIARDLFIAVSTVKSHLNSVYGKLGVKNRTQAVARARELDLL